MARVPQKASSKEVFSASDVMSLSIPLWVLDMESLRLLWANDSARKLWQAESTEELLNRDLSPDISAAVVERLKQYLEASQKSGQSFREVWTLYPEGKPCPYHIHICAHKLPDGRFGLRFEATADVNRVPEQIRSAGGAQPYSGLHLALQYGRAVSLQESCSPWDLWGRFAGHARTLCKEIGL